MVYARGPAAVKRSWEFICFLECISDATEYRKYLEKKNRFQNDLTRFLSMKGLNFVLPIYFETKLEIHSLLSLFSIIELLKEVERDTALAQVEFPGYSDAKPSQIAREMAKQVDTDKLEWVGRPMDVMLGYRGGANTVNVHRKKKGAVFASEAPGKPALNVLSECAAALEQIFRTLYGRDTRKSILLAGSARKLTAIDESEYTDLSTRHEEDDAPFGIQKLLD